MKRIRKRLPIQIIAFFIQNPIIANFFNGKIYQGVLKTICTPGLNCYSCPAATLSCPVGAIQLFLAGTKHSISLYVSGFLLAVGVTFGRFICGYICPMGLLQDLLYKIKTPKLLLKLKLLRYAKYIVLSLFVIILPIAVANELSGLGTPWYCMYICPSGTIFGALPLLAVNDFLRGFAGIQLILKSFVALTIILLTIFIFRFFCRVLCPLGAFYSFFNKFSILKMSCNHDKCISCGNCQNACLIRINPVEQPNAAECIRCGKCASSCKVGAISVVASMFPKHH